MEFKGTQGKWVVGIDYNDVVLTDSGAYRPNSLQTINSTKNELKANALLISKAPKMLEMLQEVHENGYEFSNWYELEQLIKEATEL